MRQKKIKGGYSNTKSYKSVNTRGYNKKVYRGCEGLWCAVILQAFKDLALKKGTTADKVYFNSAKFFFENGNILNMICPYLDNVPAVALKRKYRQLKEGNFVLDGKQQSSIKKLLRDI